MHADDFVWQPQARLLVQNIFVIAGYVDHVIGSHMSIDIYPPDDSGEPVNG